MVRRSATTAASLASPIACSSTMNWSPPMRATSSVASVRRRARDTTSSRRSDSRTCRATSRSSSSPATSPSVSLTRRKLSRSTCSTASLCPLAAASCTASLRCAMKRVRLGRPVSRSNVGELRRALLGARALLAERERELAHFVRMKRLLQVEQLVRRRDAPADLCRVDVGIRRADHDLDQRDRSRVCARRPRHRPAPGACACREMRPRSARPPRTPGGPRRPPPRRRCTRSARTMTRPPTRPSAVACRRPRRTGGRADRRWQHDRCWAPSRSGPGDMRPGCPGRRRPPGRGSLVGCVAVMCILMRRVPRRCLARPWET